MAEGEKKTRPKWLAALVGDARQAVVGAIVLAVLLAAGGRLLGVADTNVPLWLVGVALILAVTAVLAVVIYYERRDGRMEGELSEVRRGAATLTQHAKADAQERIDKAEKDAEGKVSAAESFKRVAISEAEERARAVDAQLQEVRRQLAEATSGVVPLTPEAQAIVHSVKSLTKDILQWDHTYASDAQKRAYRAIIDDCERVWPSAPIIKAATPKNPSDSVFSSELVTMLRQIESHAQGAGRAA